MKPFALDDLDGQIAEALRERLSRLRDAMQETEPTALPDQPEWWRAGTLVRQLPPAPVRWSWLAVLLPTLIVFAPIVAAGYALLAGIDDSRDAFVKALIVLGLTILGSITGGRLFLRGMARVAEDQLRPLFRAEIVDALIPTLWPTPIETIYLESVVALLEAQDVLGHELVRELLAPQNALLALGRRLERDGAQRQRIEAQWDAVMALLEENRTELAGLRFAPEPDERLEALRRTGRALTDQAQTIQATLPA